MVLYVDTSALFKRYVNERDSSTASALMAADPVLATSRITEIEMRRNLSLALTGGELTTARRQLGRDLDALALVAVDATTCSEASRVAEQTGCRSLDSIHVASALRCGSHTTLLTFDVRQAQAARSIGLHVIGA